MSISSADSHSLSSLSSSPSSSLSSFPTMCKPTPFDQLVNDLSATLGPDSGLTCHGTDVSYLTSLMTAYRSRESDWSPFAFADFSRGYTRNLVDRGNGKSNLLILVWTPGKGSPIHDHADAHCLMKILKGSLEEKLYEWPESNTSDNAPLKTKRRRVYSENQVTYMSDDLGLHQITNLSSTEIAVSLHLYTPPNAAKKGCHIFEQCTGKRQHVAQCHFYSEFGIKM